jgi:Tfp pilus assembly protein PilO
MALDRLQNRWEALEPRERRLVALLGLTFVVCVFGYVGFTITDGLAELGRKNEQARSDLRLIAERHDDLLEAKFRQQGEGDPFRAEAPPLATYLEEIAKEVGVQIPESSERPPSTKGRFQERTIDVKLRGLTVDQLAQFLRRVETRSLQVVTQRVYVRTTFSQKDKMDVELTVAAFERTHKADGKKDKAPDQDKPLANGERSGG